MIPDENTDGNICRCLFILRLIVKNEKPMAEIIAEKFPFQSPPPKSFQTIIKTPQKANIIDTMIEKETFSSRKYEAKKAVIIGAHANKIRALAAEVC